MSKTIRRKKILVLSPFFPPLSRVGSIKRIYNFAKYLPQYGWDPVVLTMDWGYREKGLPEGIDKLYYTGNLAKAGWKAYQVSAINEEVTLKTRIVKSVISVLRAIKRYTLIPDELILWLFLVLPKMPKIMRKEKPEAILVTAPSYSSLIVATVLKKLYGLPLIADIRDDWIDNPLMQKRSRFINAVETRQERWVVRNCDAVVLPTQSSVDLWTRRFPEARDRFHLIYNGFNEEEFNSVEPCKFNDFALVHVGSLEKPRSPETLLRALTRLDLKDLNIGFHQYGLTIRAFRELARELGLDDFTRFEGFVPSDEALSRVKGASVLVLIPTVNAPTAIPGKAFEYLRSGNPIILISDENETTRFLKPFKNVHTVASGDHEACAQKIMALYEQVNAMRDETDMEKIRQFDRKKLTGELADILDRAVSSQPPSEEAEN